MSGPTADRRHRTCRTPRTNVSCPASQELSSGSAQLVGRRDGAEVGRRGSIRLDGADGGQHQAECRERQYADRKNRPSVGCRCSKERRGGGPRRAGHANDCRDGSSSSRKSPARPICWRLNAAVEASVPASMAKGFAVVASEVRIAGGAQPDSGNGDRHGLFADRKSRAGSQRDERPAGAGYHQDSGTGD